MLRIEELLKGNDKYRLFLEEKDGTRTELEMKGLNVNKDGDLCAVIGLVETDKPKSQCDDKTK